MVVASAYRAGAQSAVISFRPANPGDRRHKKDHQFTLYFHFKLTHHIKTSDLQFFPLKRSHVMQSSLHQFSTILGLSSMFPCTAAQYPNINLFEIIFQFILAFIRIRSYSCILGLLRHVKTSVAINKCFTAVVPVCVCVCV